MKKFKLIKTYPNSPELGTIVIYYNKNFYANVELMISYTINTIEDNPEFWEELKEELCMPVGTKLRTLNNNNIYTIKDVNHTTNKVLLVIHIEGKTILTTTSIDVVNSKIKSGEWVREEGNWNTCARFEGKIEYLCRESDGQKFQVNDRVKGTSENYHLKGKVQIIKEIKINKLDNAVIITDQTNENGLNIDNIELVKPLFKSEDGVDIYEGDNLYEVSELTYQFRMMYKEISTSFEKVKGCVYFSNKESKSKWIEENKPTYSKKQIKEAIFHSTLYNTELSSQQLQRNLGL